jgi:beta-glucosidase
VHKRQEHRSEDPLLAGALGAAFVSGAQSEGVGTSVKHFVANEQELHRTTSSSNVDERTLCEIYLLPFELIVRQAHPWTLMASYNKVNGTYMTEHCLIREVLDTEWGFDGLLMYDWGAVSRPWQQPTLGWIWRCPARPAGSVHSCRRPCEMARSPSP